MTPSDFLIHQAVSRHKSALNSWVTQVVAARQDDHAFRTACHIPGPGGLIASLRSLYSADEMHAKRKVEANLMKRLEEAGTLTDRQRFDWKNMMSGRFPSVSRAIDEIGQRPTPRM